MRIVLSKPQEIYLRGLNTPFKSFVGGYGSGKTFIACIDLIYFALNHRGYTQGYFGQSYPSIRDVFYPTIEEAADLFEVDCVIKFGDREVQLHHNGNYIGTVICRSMDNPNSIVGFKIVRGVADELDVLTPAKADQAFNKIIGRLRQTITGVTNDLGVTTTPEGFGFVYEKFAKNPTESYSMVQCSSYENQKYLPPNYINSLLETYPEQLAKAFIHGEFVNLTSGSVYCNYDRGLNHSAREVNEKDALFIGMDFNVGQMAAVVHVKEKNGPIAVDEIVGALDTPDMIRAIQSRYPKNKSIRIYPDASGQSRKTNDASTSDLRLLSQAGFSVIANKSNPYVKDRVLAMQMLFNKGGVRSYLVNESKCPTYADNLEQQVYSKAGEPDKTAGKDHTNDAAGYFISYDYPINKPVHNINVKFSR